MEKSVVKFSSQFQFIEHKGTSTATIIFSACNDRPPKFTFCKTESSINPHVTLLNSGSPQRHWTGIPGTPGGIRGATKSIMNFKPDVNASRFANFRL